MNSKISVTVVLVLNFNDSGRMKLVVKPKQ